MCTHLLNRITCIYIYSASSRNVPVISEMILSPETFTALKAWEGPLIRVRAYVYQQVVALREVTVAVGANVLFLYPAHAVCRSLVGVTGE